MEPRKQTAEEKTHTLIFYTKILGKDVVRIVSKLTWKNWNRPNPSILSSLALALWERSRSDFAPMIVEPLYFGRNLNLERYIFYFS